MRKIIVFLLFSSLALAQNANRKFESFKKTNQSLEVTTSDGVYTFQPYSDKIISTSFVPNGEKANPKSHAVVASPQKVNLKITTTPTSIQMATNGIVVVIEKMPFKISYLYKNKELISEKTGYFKKDNHEILDFNLDNTEILYGTGERVLGMNRRGHRLQLYNKAHYGYETHSELMNFTMPLVLSSKIYAVHFDNAPIGYLDLDSKKDNTLAYETISGRKTYQVIAGNSWTDLIDSYTTLTGKQPLPALWTLGNFSSRFGYHSQDEVNKTIDKYLKDGIPVDAIILDLYWFGKEITGTMGNLDWDKDNFPNPTKMIDDLNQKGVKTVLITEPFITTTSSKWNETVEKKVLATDKDGKPFTFDFFFGNTGIVDIFNPDGKQWFWDVYKRLIQQGVGGFWGDLGEPEVFPSTAITKGGTADEVHNIYGHHWAELIAEGYKKDFTTTRPFILMRSGYSGSQRFGMMPWTGDVNRTWGGLQPQTEISLQMGLQGIGYMHSDLGGFAGDYYDNELYLRWLQYGVFQPIFRPHAQQEVPSEPVFKDIVTKANAKKQVELRYQLLPYNYTIAFVNNQKGTPLMRPLFFEEPENKTLQTVAHTYLWGNDFLVHPITEAGKKSAEIYFPKNNTWFDFYSDAQYQGGSTANVATATDHIPVFVRGGAFIPMIKTIQNTTKYSLDSFDLHYFMDEKTTNSEGKLYNDDGLTSNAFEKGNYEILNFKAISKNKVTTITVATQVGKTYTSKDKKANLILHNAPTASQIKVNGVVTPFTKESNTINVSIPVTKNKPTLIQIQ
ncbi:TIM-barrel domain-containing protein [Flavobacterium sp.]|uniref:glycoside hydrolase family 31 protein n=1 Tax=Flavobacterium sp. TaxID=239 RepID=UPI0026223EE5|nr:TIM-barrel domain-containing protein [Flavobacterium sp.]